MSFLFLIISFLLLVFSRQLFINLLANLVGPKSLKTFYFLLFLPGVILHEFAHFAIATLLLVPTGEISIFPEGEKIGSIRVAKTDPFRQALIGLAPIFIGTGLILAIFHFIEAKNFFWYYLVFAINNTMFASESDRRSWFGFLALIALIASGLYLFNLINFVAGPLVFYFGWATILIATAYGSTFMVNLLFIIPLFVLQRIVLKLK